MASTTTATSIDDFNEKKNPIEEEASTCGICYGPLTPLKSLSPAAEEDDDEEKQVIQCENEKCHQEYHQSCFVEFLLYLVAFFTVPITRTPSSLSP